MNHATEPTIMQHDTLYALASAAGVVYAARASGLYRSRDGLHWQNTFASLGTDEPPAAVAVVAHGSTVFVGVNGAVLRSDDAGETWSVAPLAAPPPLVTALALSPRFDEDNVVLAGTAEDGVFVSTDRGISWVPWNFGLIDKSVFALVLSPDFACDQTAYAGTSSGVFASPNGGRGWRDRPFPEDAAPVLCLEIAPDGRLFAGTEARGLYASSDAGQTWQRVAAERLPGGVQALWFTPGALIVLLENALLTSSDGGDTWREQTPAFAPDRIAIAMTPDAAGGLHVGFVDGEIVSVAV